MSSAYLASDNIISSLGFTTAENMAELIAGESGIRLYEDGLLSPSPYWASRVDDVRLNGVFSRFGDPGKFTRFEKLLISSATQAMEQAETDTGRRTLCILSTTKGNIDLLNQTSGVNYEADRVYLWHTAALLKRHFGFVNDVLVVSNACISGLLAIILGARYIRSGQYDNVVVTGADLVSEFVLSGFNSFLSLSDGPCKPFDRHRQGLSLGEAAGTVVLTSEPGPGRIRFGQGFASNDANHISGPSRNGDGLFLAISRTLAVEKVQVDYISAHGTATPYNDEMESIALTRAALQDVPVNSFKGYWGHTLGAAGIIETIAGAGSLTRNILIGTRGFSEPGTTHPVAVIAETRHAELHTCLKMASGFGGCNAAIILSK